MALMKTLDKLQKIKERDARAKTALKSVNRASKADYLGAKKAYKQAKWAAQKDRMMARRSTANIAAVGSAIAAGIGAARKPSVESNLQAWNSINNQTATPAPNTGNSSDTPNGQHRSTGDPHHHGDYANYGDD